MLQQANKVLNTNFEERYVLRKGYNQTISEFRSRVGVWVMFLPFWY